MEKNKHGRRQRGCKCSPRLEERTNGRRDGDGASERASGAEEGRESPECKAMFGRNVQPPVHSCNSTGSGPESCLPRRGGAEDVVEGGDEGNKMDVERRR